MELANTNCEGRCNLWSAHTVELHRLFAWEFFGKILAIPNLPANQKWIVINARGQSCCSHFALYLSLRTILVEVNNNIYVWPNIAFLNIVLKRTKQNSRIFNQVKGQTNLKDLKFIEYSLGTIFLRLNRTRYSSKTCPCIP